MVELDAVPGEERQILAEIAGERMRQIGEGYDETHDDGHEGGEIALAAACFAVDGASNRNVFKGIFGKAVGAIWPWDMRHFKQRPQRRQLIVAAALIVAEIERIDRKAQRRG